MSGKTSRTLICGRMMRNSISWLIGMFCICFLVINCKEAKRPKWQQDIIDAREGAEKKINGGEPASALETEEQIHYPPRKMEVFGDPSIFDQPRLQFIWQGYDDDYETIWSIKTDGSDLRQVVDSTFLRSIGFKSFTFYDRKPVRSGNNRWLTFGYATEESYTNLMVMDLKNCTVRIIIEGMSTQAVFTKDSKYFYMKCYGQVLKVDIEKSNIDTIHLQNSTPPDTQFHRYEPYAFFIDYQSGLFYGLTDNGYQKYSSNLKLIENVVLWKIKTHCDKAFSPDAKYLVCSMDTTVIFDINGNNKIIYSETPYYRSPVFSPDGQYIYYRDLGINKVNWKTKSDVVIFKSHKSPNSMTLINFN